MIDDNGLERARQIVAAACRYHGGKSLERLRELEAGEYETDDQELAYAIRMAATIELRKER